MSRTIRSPSLLLASLLVAGCSLVRAAPPARPAPVAAATAPVLDVRAAAAAKGLFP